MDYYGRKILRGAQSFGPVLFVQSAWNTCRLAKPNRLSLSGGSEQGSPLEAIGQPTQVVPDRDSGTEYTIPRNLPSMAPTCVTAMPGDCDKDEDGENDGTHAHIQPDWTGSLECIPGWMQEGEWEIRPRYEERPTRVNGDGQQRGDEEEEGAEEGVFEERSGVVGVFCGNWGGNWTMQNLQQSMCHDVKSSPAMILAIQEASKELEDYTRMPPMAGVLDSSSVSAIAEDPLEPRPKRVWLTRPLKQFWAIRGPEKKNSVMICARRTLAAGMRLLLWCKHSDGEYICSKSKQNKMAFTRILVVCVRMRYMRLRVSGAEASATDEGSAHAPPLNDLHDDGQDPDLVFMNVHMNNMTAKKAIKKAALRVRDLWDVIAAAILRHKVRFLVGDFNMALWTVVPELRARGFQANLIAWYPWKVDGSEMVHMDSCAIIAIGPLMGAHRLWDPTLLGVKCDHDNLTLPSWSNTMEHYKDEEEGDEDIIRPWPLSRFQKEGQGYPLASYQPKDTNRKAKLVIWSFTPALQPTDSVVRENVDAAMQDRAMWPNQLHNRDGAASWTWPMLALMRQRPVELRLFDPLKEIFRRGAHMPLLVFIGANRDQRRTPEAEARRAKRAEARGWTAERRVAHAARHGSKGKYKGKKNHGSGHQGQPRVNGDQEPQRPTLQLEEKRQIRNEPQDQLKEDWYAQKWHTNKTWGQNYGSASWNASWHQQWGAHNGGGWCWMRR